MKLSKLLKELEKYPAITITEERVRPDNKRVFTFSTPYPFPKLGGAWYSMVISHDDEDIRQEKIDAMLRHLWMFQIDIQA